MADTRLTQPTTPVSSMTAGTHKMLVGISEFFWGSYARLLYIKQSLRKHHDRLPLTRADQVRELMRYRTCHCHGTCASCRHIIDDVLGQ